MIGGDFKLFTALETDFIVLTGTVAMFGNGREGWSLAEIPILSNALPSWSKRYIVPHFP